MKIKKHKNRNEYAPTPQGMWVRNFSKNFVPYVDINPSIQANDYWKLLQNEIINNQLKFPWIDSENFIHDKIVIISDGYDFNEKIKLLSDLPKDIVLIGVNKTLKNWTLPRSLNYYVANNPYDDCMLYNTNKKSLPKGIFSTRTNHQFVKLYKGAKYRYCPVSPENYTGERTKEVRWQIDDYRNPICAALGLAYRFQASKILLFCCDSVFPDERPTAEKLDNGLYLYPQQMIAHGLIDGTAHWLKKNKIQVADHSSGKKYENIPYIENANIMEFLVERAVI